MNYSKKREFILEGKMSKVILVLSGPLMINNLIQTIYNLTDTYFVSILGDTEVAAITLIWPVIFFMMSLGIGVSIAGTTLISQYIGSDNYTKAKYIAGQIISFSLVFSFVLGIIGFIISPHIIRFMGGEGDLFTYSNEFLRIIFLGMPTMFIFFAFNAIKQGQGDTMTPMRYGALSVGLNIILDPIFIFVLDMDIQGAALATVLARGVFAIYALYTLFNKNTGIQLTKKDLIFNKELLQKIIKIGLPSSIGQSTAALGFTVLNIFILSFGEETITAFGIGNRINSLILMPAMGIGSALATIVGQNLGADNIKRAKEAVKTSAFIATIFLVIGGSIIFSLSEKVVGIFSDNAIVLKQGSQYLKLISMGLPLVGFFQIFIGTFQGSGHTISAMIIMMGRLWGLRIPMILIFKKFTNLGPSSVWYSMVLSNAFICIIGFGIYMTGKWKKKVIKRKV
ncbi:MATE family efflux transporter [Clostridiisalibacter paucivorans]|uniref:MATE family efflux transporter n=1 Tax=Clostridiisalibacter paucivorans TaxID=408753 RepID=UPI00047CDB2F|nr:MATE family efflux transporter [Clostridiisalibacter paucivorans]